MRQRRAPTSRSAFNLIAEEFRKWLVHHGSAIFVPTNPYEVTRFMSATGIAIIWTDKSGKLSYSPDAQDAITAFLANKDWRATERGTRNRPSSKKRAAIIRNLMHRDGKECLYCTEELTLDTATIEHMIPVTAGGTNHPANMTLACDDCNKEADAMSVREKLELAIRKRGGWKRRTDNAGKE